MILLDAEAGVLQLNFADEQQAARLPGQMIGGQMTSAPTDSKMPDHLSLGRGLFALQRQHLGSAESGASFLATPYDYPAH